MLVNTYTLPQLIDLALRVPEIGAVNFNILHTVLRTLVQATGTHSVRPWCNIENPVVAQAALTSMKLKPPPLKRSFSAEFLPLDGEEFRARIISTDLPRPQTADETHTRDTPGEQITQQSPDTPGIPAEGESTQEQAEHEDAIALEGEAETGATAVESEERPPEETTPEGPPEPTERTEPEVLRPSTSGADIMTGIDQGKQSQIMSEVWRATNVNRRMDAAEEGLQKLSYVVDRFVDRLNDMAGITEELQRNMETIQPKFDQLVEDVEELREYEPIRRDIDTIRKSYATIEETKIDKTDLPGMLVEAELDEPPRFLDHIEEKVDYVGGAVKCILDETGIIYVAPPPHLFETPETSHQPRRHPPGKDKVHRPKKKKVHKPPKAEPKDEGDEHEGEEEAESEAEKEKENEEERVVEEEGVEEEEEEVEEEEEEEEPEPPEDEYVEIEEEFPESEKEEKAPSHFVPVGRPTADSLNHRFENIWDELESHKNLIMKLQKHEEEDHQEEEVKVEELERVAKKLVEDVEFLTLTIERLDTDSKSKQHFLDVLQDAANELQYAKAEKEEVHAALLLKADKRDVDRKVERVEFEATVNDLGDAIEGLVGKLRSTENDFQSVTDDIYRELMLRLTTDDYRSMQEPIHNRLFALMYGFKSMKSLILRSIYPEAAGVTKCISCGRPAELAGTRFKETGDVPMSNRKYDDFDKKDLTPFDPYDRDKGHGGPGSFVSLPSSSLSKSSSDGGAHLCTECEENSTTKENTSPSAGSGSPMEHSDQRSTSSNTGASNEGSLSSQRNATPGLKRRKTKQETDGSFDKLVSTKPATRFCGGEHTRTKPSQKGIVFSDLELPPRSRECTSLLGYDKVWYKGSVPIEKEGELPRAVDPNSLQIDELISCCYEEMPPVPPRDFPEPRYCGGTHTTTDPLQRGLKFSALRLSEEPVRRQTEIHGRDGGVYKNVSDERNMDARSSRDGVRSSFSRKSSQTESRPGVSAPEIGRKALKPNVVSITMDDNTMNNSNSSRVRLLSVPRSQINRPGPARFQAANYAPSFTNSNQGFNSKERKK